MRKIKEILLTRAAATYPLLATWCKDRAIQLTEESLIKIESVKGLVVPETTWVFFSSPKGAKTYLDNYPVKAKRIAVFGKGTLNALKEFNLSADFIGDFNLEPRAIGEVFNENLKRHESVLFPISQLSKRSILKEITRATCHEMICYQTVLTPTEFEKKFDCLFFTSPSNFRSFIQTNVVNPEALLIAMGKTTEKEISQTLPHHKVHTLNEPSQEAMIKILEGFN